MLSHLLPLIEADAAQKGEEFLGRIRFNRARNRLMWSVFIGSALVAFALVLLSVVIAARHAPSRTWIYVGAAIALLIVFTGEHFKSDFAFLNKQTVSIWRAIAKTTVWARSDFLRVHEIGSYLLVVLPALIAVLMLATQTVNWVKPNSNGYKDFADLLKQIATFTGTLLATQIALFNFMFAQLLGKYSSAIAVAVSKHRVIQVLRAYLTLLLVALFVFYLFGFPDALPKAAICLTTSLAATLILTIWVSNTGIRIDQAILYTGRHSARIIEGLIKPPILQYTTFWKALAALGLDWRDPERMVPTVSPRQASSAATTLASGLFNAAHKSAQENQHESFWASLVALSVATEAYVKRRRSYLGSDDPFLNYLNDQLAALAKAAAKAPNEYMVTNTIMTIGSIGSLALEVGRGPDLPGVPKEKYLGFHPSFVHWQALLSECFELSHGLMRTTAASEVLTQLKKLAKKSIDLKYSEDVSMSFTAELSRIYGVCLLKRTPYLLSLAGQCVRALMDVWNYSLKQGGTEMAGVSKTIGETIKNMLVAFQAAGLQPTFDLRDPVTTVTTKIEKDQVSLQEIGLSILNRPINDDWERRLSVNEFDGVLKLVTELAKDAIANQPLFADNYGKLFYDYALLVLTSIPKEWNEPEREAEKFFHIEREPIQDKFESKIAESVKQMIPLYYRAKRSVLDWEHEVFSIIGMAAAIYSETGRESARVVALEGIQAYREEIEHSKREHGRVPDDDWDYLQLAGVWVRHLLKDDQLADKFVQEVADGRPYSFGMFSGGRTGWGHYGYPNVSIMGADFHILRSRNIVLSRGSVENIERWQQLLMSPDQLTDTYEKIEKIREPVRQRLLEKLEQDRKARKPPSPPSRPKPDPSTEDK